MWCRQTKIAEWSMRGYHELISHRGKAVFATLTYRNGDSGYDGNLHKEHIRSWIKRLRKLYPCKIRYIVCGEYGTKRGRPHYHAILYGIEPGGEAREKIKKTWPHGHADVSSRHVTGDAIQYTIGYMGKQLKQQEWYEKRGLNRPYKSQSNGIGGAWSIANRDDWMSTMSIGHAGGQRPVPRYYQRLVYSEEGRKYESTRTVINIGGTRRTEKTYRLLRNPMGKKTSKMIEVSISECSKRMRETMKNVTWIDSERIINQYELAKMEWLSELHGRWGAEHKLDDAELCKRYATEHDMRKINTESGVMDQTALEPEEAAAKSKYIERYEQEKMNGLYGKRERFCLLSELT